jgi:hypothetical protein
VTSGRHALRLDPWGAEYEGSIQIGDEEEPVPAWATRKSEVAASTFADPFAGFRGE